jgi:hypothetical protein
MNPGMAEIRFGNKRNSQKARRTLGARRAFYLFPMNSEQSGDVIAAATTNAIWLMRESRFEVRFAPINGNGQHRGARLLSANKGSAAASFRKACLDETIDIQLVRPSRSVARRPLRNAKIGTTIKQSSHRISHFFFAT